MEGPYTLKRPKDIASWIIRAVADETYLIFDRKKDLCRCSRCGAVRKISEMNDGDLLRHNVKHYCYDCKNQAIAKEAWYGRKGITEYGRILWFQKRGNETFAQLDEYQINYTEREPVVTFWVSAQYRFCKESQEYYKHVPETCWHPDFWEKRKNIKLPQPAAGMWNHWKNQRYEKTVTHLSWVTERGTDLKYANPDMLRLGFNKLDNPYAIIGYIYNFLKYPSIEILEKAGFEKLVGERANGWKCRYINWRTADLRKILGLDNKEIREFRESGGTMLILGEYKKAKNAGWGLRFDQLRYIPAYGVEKTMKTIETFIPVKKAAAYLDTQEESARFMDYADYLRECDTLGYNMKDKKVLRPANLMKAHEETSQLVTAELDRRMKAEFIRQQETIYPWGEYRDGDLLIRLAAGPDELNKESQVLGHCVRTYKECVARGECAILFVRKVCDESTPYYTLELSPERRIMQCRGRHNRSMTGEVEAFVKKWLKEIVLKKRKKGAAAPAA